MIFGRQILSSDNERLGLHARTDSMHRTHKIQRSGEPGAAGLHAERALAHRYAQNMYVHPVALRVVRSKPVLVKWRRELRQVSLRKHHGPAGLFQPSSLRELSADSCSKAHSGSRGNPHVYLDRHAVRLCISYVCTSSRLYNLAPSCIRSAHTPTPQWTAAPALLHIRSVDRSRLPTALRTRQNRSSYDDSCA